MMLRHASIRPSSSAKQPAEDAETGMMTRAAATFKVVLFNDEEHTYDYVVEMLTHVCDLSRENAFRCAVEVDLTGRTVVCYGSRPECDATCSRILSYGPDHRLPQSMGSMNAEIQGR